MERSGVGRRGVLGMLGAAIVGLGGRAVDAETVVVPEEAGRRVPLKMHQFVFGKTPNNEGLSHEGALSIYTYTMYVKTDAPALSPVIVSYTGGGNPAMVCGISAQPWKLSTVLVEVNAFVELAAGDEFSVTVMQQGATKYGTVSDTPEGSVFG